MSLGSSLFGAAIGFGLGGNARSAIGGAAAGYALNKFAHHQPLFGGACGEGKAHSSETGRCIKIGGAAHRNLEGGYTEKQFEAMKKALHKARSKGYADYSPEMKIAIAKAIRKAR